MGPDKAAVTSESGMDFTKSHCYAIHVCSVSCDEFQEGIALSVFNADMQ